MRPARIAAILAAALLYGAARADDNPGAFWFPPQQMVGGDPAWRAGLLLEHLYDEELECSNGFYRCTGSDNTYSGYQFTASSRLKWNGGFLSNTFGSGGFYYFKALPASITNAIVTWSAWALLDDDTGASDLYACGHLSGQDFIVYQNGAGSGFIRSAIYATNGSTVIASTSFSDNTIEFAWHMITVAWSGTNSTMYYDTNVVVNGSTLGAGTLPMRTPASAHVAWWSDSDVFLVDSYRIWTRCLTAQDVQSVYAEGCSAVSP